MPFQRVGALWTRMPTPLMASIWTGYRTERIDMDLRRLKLYLSIGYLSLKYGILHHHPFKKPLVKSIARVDPTFSGRSTCLFDHYAVQFNGAACSVATAATILNCARRMIHGASKPPLTQEEILNTVRVVDWKERIVPSKKGGARGLPLKELGIAIRAALSTYHLPVDEWEVVDFTTEHSLPDVLKERLRDHLTRLSSSKTHFMVAHFNQGVFLKGLHLPHISPVGMFHPESGEVLVMDVDKAGPGPYWVPFELFFKGLFDDFGGRLKSFGYEGGGYIWFALKME